MTFGYPSLVKDDWNPAARRDRFISAIQPLSVELLNTPSTPKKSKTKSESDGAGQPSRSTPVFLRDDPHHPIAQGYYELYGGGGAAHHTCDLIYQPDNNPNRKNKKKRATTPFKRPPPLAEEELLECEEEPLGGVCTSLTLGGVRQNKTICFDERAPTIVASEPQIRLGRGVKRENSQPSESRSRRSRVTGILSSRTQLSSVASTSSYNSTASTMMGHLSSQHPPHLYGMDYVCESGSEFLVQSSTPGTTPGSTSRPGENVSGGGGGGTTTSGTGMEWGSRAMELAQAQQLQDLIRMSSDSISASRIPRSSSMQSLPTHQTTTGPSTHLNSIPGTGRRPSQPLSECTRSSSQQMSFAWTGGGGGIGGIGGGGSETSFSVLHHTITLEDNANGSHQRLVPPPPPLQLLRTSPSDRSVSLLQSVNNTSSSTAISGSSSGGVSRNNNNNNSGGGGGGGGLHQAVRPTNPLVIGKTSIAHATKPSTVIAASKVHTNSLLKPNDEGAKWLMYLSNSNEQDLQDYI